MKFTRKELVFGIACLIIMAAMILNTPMARASGTQRQCTNTSQGSPKSYTTFYSPDCFAVLCSHTRCLYQGSYAYNDNCGSYGCQFL